MIAASQIVELRTAATDYVETEELKLLLARHARERQPIYLTLEEFDRILRWKLVGQYGRGQLMRVGNTDEVVRTVTSAALTVSHEDKDYEVELRVGILCAMRGVGVPVASAILALAFPSDYAVIDFRGWRQVFEEDRRIFSINDYKRYLHECRRLSRELGWPVQEVDLAIWEYDRRQG